MVVDVIVLGEDAAGVVPRHARLLAVALHRGLPPPPLHRGQVQLRTVDIVDVQGESKKIRISKTMAITPLKSIRKGKSWCVLENSG